MINLQTTFTYSEMKSLRAVVASLFPLAPSGPPFYLGGRARAVAATRPFWRVDVPAPGSVQRVASGWEDGNRSYVVGYYGSTFADVEEKISALRVAFSVGVPFRAYDASWFQPYLEAIPTGVGTNLNAGTYTVSASLVNDAVSPEEETLCGLPRSLTLASTGRIAVYVPSWPWQSPLQGKARIYVASGVNPRRRLLTAPTFQPVRGWSLLTVTAVPVTPALVEPVSSAFTLGWLNITSLTQHIYENPEVDGEFDGVLSLGVSRPLQLPHSDSRKTYSDLVIATTPDPGAGVGGIT